MTNLELLSDVQTELLAGGRGRYYPSLTSTTSSMDITNLISQSNVGSAWSSGAIAGAGTGFRGWGGRSGGAGETEVEAEANNIQKNFLALNNFGFSLAF